MPAKGRMPNVRRILGKASRRKSLCRTGALSRTLRVQQISTEPDAGSELARLCADGRQRTERFRRPKDLTSRAPAGQLRGVCEKRSASESAQDHVEIHDARALGGGREGDLSL